MSLAKSVHIGDRNWKGKSSNTGSKEPCNRPGFWSDPKNHYWENDSYTEEGKKILREFVKKLKNEEKERK